METIKNRYDFVYLFDVQDGNPNGDPDAGNLPRVDAETGMGLVTDVCLKRKIRNYVQLAKGGTAPYDIFIKEKAILNKLIAEAHESESVKSKKDAKDKTAAARAYMCSKYYDVRTFGAVMSTGEKEAGQVRGKASLTTDQAEEKPTRKNAGQVRGPVQLTFARSVEPVVVAEHSITRIAVTTEKEAEEQGGENHTMGRKSTIPYGLYLCHGFISPAFAAQTGFTDNDLALLWEALKNMFDIDHSAARGLMSARKLIVFKHDSQLGNAPANVLFDSVTVKKKNAGTVARSFGDYEVSINNEDLPSGVTIEVLL